MFGNGVSAVLSSRADSRTRSLRLSEVELWALSSDSFAILQYRLPSEWYLSRGLPFKPKPEKLSDFSNCKM